jgi:hypothetical protein
MTNDVLENVILFQLQAVTICTCSTGARSIYHKAASSSSMYVTVDYLKQQTP